MLLTNWWAKLTKAALLWDISDPAGHVSALLTLGELGSQVPTLTSHTMCDWTVAVFHSAFLAHSRADFLHLSQSHAQPLIPLVLSAVNDLEMLK